MSIEYSIFKPVTLPAVLEANAIYFTEGVGATDLNITVTGKLGLVHRSVITRSEVTTMLSNVSNVTNTIMVVDDIVERNAQTYIANTIVLVKDASSESDVDGGSALYLYTYSDSSYYKLTEYESLELNWDSIKDKPQSTVSEIDAIITALNGDLINIIKGMSTVNGDLTFNNKTMGSTYYPIDPEW